jgi:hypothetical protein
MAGTQVAVDLANPFSFEGRAVLEMLRATLPSRRQCSNGG